MNTIIDARDSIILNGSANDFLKWISESEKSLYHELKSHKFFKRFLGVHFCYGAFCLTGRYCDMNYLIAIQGQLSTASNIATIYANAEIEETEK